jgi:hypothetical protein
MPIQETDTRLILFRLARQLTSRSVDAFLLDVDEGGPALKWQREASHRGSVRYAEIVHQGLVEQKMSLQHLVLVSQKAVAQVKAEMGDGPEYMGALLTMVGLLGFVRGGWKALADPLLATYKKG